MRIAILLTVLAVFVMPRVKAAPLNNSTEAQDVQTVTAVENESTTQVQAQQDTPKTQEKTERTVTWKDNPNNCDTDTQFILKDTFECQDKPKAVKQSEGVTNCGDNIYKQYIYQKESGCRTNAINSSSGACGIGQALPCTKLPCSLSDYACQDAWFSNYAITRYGSWENAYNFWVNNHWW